MRTKLKRFAKITIQTVCLSALCACQTQHPSAILSAAPEPPLAFPVVPVPPPPPDESAVLMARYGDSLRRFNPIKIYSDVANIVVVQKIVFGVESGKYIMPSCSSYIPGLAEDGKFILTTQPGSRESMTNFGGDIGMACVWDYQRSVASGSGK
jgi:hypothetical protein